MNARPPVDRLPGARRSTLSPQDQGGRRYTLLVRCPVCQWRGGFVDRVHVTEFLQPFTLSEEAAQAFGRAEGKRISRRFARRHVVPAGYCKDCALGAPHVLVKMDVLPFPTHILL